MKPSAQTFFRGNVLTYRAAHPRAPFDADMTLTQISLECGFCDQAHFSHMFTRSEGITPFAWRCQTVRALPLLKRKRSQAYGIHIAV